MHGFPRFFFPCTKIDFCFNSMSHKLFEVRLRIEKTVVNCISILVHEVPFNTGNSKQMCFPVSSFSVLGSGKMLTAFTEKKKKIPKAEFQRTNE